MKTPVLFVIFNRPDTTRRVFSAIRESRPPRLYIAADGPRQQHPEDKAKVRLVRDYVTSSIDWDCRTKLLFRDENLGCKTAVSSAITWFFENEEMGIILEDDCIPDQSFFAFCEELLERYKDDTRIMHIGGSNFQEGLIRGSGSYYFSRYNHVWGWASWRRAWNLYDPEMKDFYVFKQKGLIKSIFTDPAVIRYWLGILQATKKGKINSWAYRWAYAMWRNAGLAVLPNKNLISNIGFGPGATHTTASEKCANMRIKNMGFPLIHPNDVTVCLEADLYTFKEHFYRSFLCRVLSKIKGILFNR